MSWPGLYKVYIYMTPNQAKYIQILKMYPSQPFKFTYPSITQVFETMLPKIGSWLLAAVPNAKNDKSHLSWGPKQLTSKWLQSDCVLATQVDVECAEILHFRLLISTLNSACRHRMLVATIQYKFPTSKKMTTRIYIYIYIYCIYIYIYMGVSLNGGTPKNTPKWWKPMAVGYHHLGKHPYRKKIPNPVVSLGWSYWKVLVFFSLSQRLDLVVFIRRFFWCQQVATQKKPWEINP